MKPVIDVIDFVKRHIRCHVSPLECSGIGPEAKWRPCKMQSIT
jgi:hypothetical protein